MSNLTHTTPILLRQEKLKSLLPTAGLDGLLLNPGPSLIYLTGLHFHLSERPVVAFFMLDESPVIVFPELEQEKLKILPFEIQAFPYGEDPSHWVKSFQSAAQAAGVGSKRVGVEPRQLRFLEYDLLSKAAPRARFVPADETVSRLRMYKDADELSSMREAVDVAQRALEFTLPQVKIGMTELELASELMLQLFRAGCDPEVPFSPIVSCGENGANPHATPSEKKLTPGNLLVIDWGASHAGYFSDITRTFALGQVEPEYEKIGKVVLEANEAARKAAGPGVAAEVVDQAARRIIASAGYGKYFTHRTGHGLGMEAHEEPYIRAGSQLLLEPGMTFTIEPGIYLPDKNGVRIEDNVVITATGMECLTSLPREVRRLI